MTFDPGQQHALIIAIDEYAHRDWSALSCPVRDGRAVGTVLIDRFQFPASQVHYLFNAAAKKRASPKI